MVSHSAAHIKEHISMVWYVSDVIVTQDAVSEQRGALSNTCMSHNALCAAHHYFSQLIAGVCYLHAAGITHRYSVYSNVHRC